METTYRRDNQPREVLKCKNCGETGIKLIRNENNEVKAHCYICGSIIKYEITPNHG